MGFLSTVSQLILLMLVYGKSYKSGRLRLFSYIVISYLVLFGTTTRPYLSLEVNSYEVKIPLIFFAITYLYIIENQNFISWRLTIRNGWKLVVGGLLYSFVSVLFMYLCAQLITSVVCDIPTTINGVLLPIAIGFIEEFVYRGVLLGICTSLQINTTLANAIQTMVFSISHFRYLETGEIGVFICVVLLAWFLGYITIKHDSVLPGSIVHSMVNVLFRVV